MKIKTRILGVILVLALVFGTVFGDFCEFNDVSDTYAGSGGTITLKESELNEGYNTVIYDPDPEKRRINVDKYELLVLDMDAPLHVNECDIGCSVLVHGTDTLYIDGFVNVNGSFELGKDAAINFEKAESCIKDNSSISGTSFTCFGKISATDNINPVICGFDEIDIEGSISCSGLANYLINTPGDIYMNSGSITADNSKRAPIYSNNFYMCGGTITSTANTVNIYAVKNIRITGGTLDLTTNSINTTNSALFARKKISISGGTVKAYSDLFNGIYGWGKMEITGGYVEASTGCADNEYSAIETFDALTIGSGLAITEPSGGKIVNDSSKHYRVVDSSGKNAKKVVIQKYVPDSGSNSGSNSGSQGESSNGSSNNTSNGSSNNTSGGSSGNNSAGNTSGNTKPSNEWIKGQWYDSNGNASYKYKGSWKSDSKGWWFEDASGWYPVSQWQKIDGKWYYFLDSGYMDYGEYRDGYWLGSDGALVDGYQGEWKSDSIGWWFEDTSGWYPTNQYLWIDGVQYWFDASGYMA